MYVLVNVDGSINAVGEHPLPSHINLWNVERIERSEQTVADVMGSIPWRDALWDRDTQRAVARAETQKGSPEWREAQASIHIRAQYPLYQQVNVLRSKDKAALSTMVQFIDACRAWSNDQTQPVTQLKSIQPQSVI